MDAIRFDLRGVESVHVPNGYFSLDNDALAVLAYLGGRPSDLEAVEGSMLPLTTDANGDYAVAQIAVAQGRRLLEDAAWGPEDDDGGVELL